MKRIKTFDSPHAIGRLYRHERGDLVWFCCSVETHAGVVTVRGQDGLRWFGDEAAASAACLAAMAGLAVQIRALARACLPTVQESLLLEDSPFS